MGARTPGWCIPSRARRKSLIWRVMSKKQREVRSAAGFQMAVVWQMLLVVLPAFAISMWGLFTSDHLDLYLGVLGLGLVGSIWVRNRAYGRFRCPECGLHIPQRKEGQHYDGYAFYCQKCRIVWVYHEGE